MSLLKRELQFTIFVGFAGLFLSACPPTTSTPPVADFGITATKGAGHNIVIRGRHFTPGGQLKITYANIPNRPGTTDGGPMPAILPDGTFVFAETFNCTSHDAGDENALVFVNACDLATANCAPANVKAGGIWVNTADPNCK